MLHALEDGQGWGLPIGAAATPGEELEGYPAAPVVHGFVDGHGVGPWGAEPYCHI